MSSLSRAFTRTLPILVGLLLALPANASISVPSDGSDGVFAPTASVQVDLSQAVTGTWDQDNTANTGKGVFDPTKWAVVFKYSSVTIPTGATVTFKNHPSGAPVVWLVQGDVTINTGAVLNLNGADGTTAGGFAEPGPGGFRGGSAGSSGTPPPAGFGPGGGSLVGPTDYYGAGSYGTRYDVVNAGPIYGNPQVVPLIGGSGGCGTSSYGYYGAGAGGGAILIAAGGTITLYNLTANGGVGSGTYGTCGSGGAVRLIADTISRSGSGSIYARGLTSPVGVTSGDGRIRLEANNFVESITCDPGASIINLIGLPPVIWPPVNLPSVAISKIAGGNSPADPWAVLSSPEHYTTIATVQPIVVQINAVNVPLDWNVALRVVPFSGADSTILSTKVSGDASVSVWEATITPKMGVSSLQVRAYKP